MDGKMIKYMLFLLLTFSSALAIGQTGDKEALRSQYNDLLNEIRKTEEVLAETKKNKQASVGELEALQRKIDIRKRLIGNISDQISGLDGKILETQGVILSMERDLDDLRDEYSRMVLHAYLNQDAFDKVGFVFASEDFSEALQKIQYFREYTEFREEQVKIIQETQEVLSFKVSELEDAKAEKRGLLVEEERQRSTLDSERDEQNAKIKTLANIESKLLSAINRKKRDAEALNKKIEAIIADEIAKERRRALEAANAAGENTGSRGSAVPTLTPEMRLLSDQFSGNRGRLPWPVERGSISGKFGKRLHPILRDPPVYVQSNGVDISTPENAAVRSIFDGEVVNVLANPTFQRGVIIKHGEYFTVYTKLRTVDVKPGDKIKARQPIGTVFTDSDANKTEVHLEVWKGTTLLNPEDWIGKQ